MKKRGEINLVKSEIRQDITNNSPKANIIYKNCIGCGKCLDVCEPKAIPESYIGYISLSAKIDKNLCTGCGNCIKECKYSAIVLL